MGTQRVTSEHGEFTLFFTFRSPFSNFYRCSFKASSSDGTSKRFCCVEQYYMYNKALSADDDDAAARIFSESDPKTMKRIGMEIKGFSQDRWNELSSEVMKNGLLAKFSQEPNLRFMLMLTKNSQLVECSPTDQVWGIGLGIDSPLAVNPEKWRGTNRLGKILDQVREAIWNNDSFKEDRNEVEKQLELSDKYAHIYFDTKFPARTRTRVSSVYSSFSPQTPSVTRKRSLVNRLSFSNTRKERSSSTEERRRSRSDDSRRRRRSSDTGKDRSTKHRSESSSSSSTEEEYHRGHRRENSSVHSGRQKSVNIMHKNNREKCAKRRHQRRRERSSSPDVMKCQRRSSISSKTKRSRHDSSGSSATFSEDERTSRKHKSRRRHVSGSDSSSSHEEKSHERRRHSGKKHSHSKRERKVSDRSSDRGREHRDRKGIHNESALSPSKTESVLKLVKSKKRISSEQESNEICKHESSVQGCSEGNHDAAIEFPTEKESRERNKSTMQQEKPPTARQQNQLHLEDTLSRKSSPDESVQIDAILRDMKQSQDEGPIERKTQEVKTAKLTKKARSEKTNSWLNRINRDLRRT